MYKNIVNTLKITRELIGSYVENGDIVIDCTAGNGHDTLQLARAVGRKGFVYAFDIQEEAIFNTKEKLEKADLLDNTKIILDGHENIDKYIEGKVEFIIYNLGYLPGDNKDIITKSDTTIKSIEKSLNLLENNGLLVVTSYIGHLGGKEENESLEKLFKSLEQKKYNVLKHEFINQKNDPPILYIIEKSRK